MITPFFAALIDSSSDPGNGADNTTSVNNLPKIGADKIFANGLDIMYFLLGAIAVIIIIVAGIMYATSAGNAGTVTKAKNALTYAIVGLVIVLLAFTITQFITGRF